MNALAQPAAALSPTAPPDDTGRPWRRAPRVAVAAVLRAGAEA